MNRSYSPRQGEQGQDSRATGNAAQMDAGSNQHLIGLVFDMAHAYITDLT
jgi:hypothetical protein